MSDGKEVKRLKALDIMFMCGEKNGVDTDSLFVSVSDHDRIVEELKQSVAALGRRNDPNASYRDTLNNKLQETIAELRAEVIKLNSKLGFLIGVMKGIVVYADDEDMRREFARRAIEKLAAIEKEGAKDD